MIKSNQWANTKENASGLFTEDADLSTRILPRFFDVFNSEESLDIVTVWHSHTAFTKSHSVRLIAFSNTHRFIFKQAITFISEIFTEWEIATAAKVSSFQ